jgi:NAD(P)H-dependent flavin oxidoreductase YrpB (nitropropane dioxygenase family)
VVEGPKVGGHLGFKKDNLDEKSHSLESLVHEVRQVVLSMKKPFKKDIPIIAAGGIYSGEDENHSNVSLLDIRVLYR